MRVFVKNMRGEPLMPCSPRKARILLKEGRAKIAAYEPFAIQLNYATGETVQPVDVGVDTGSRHIGIAVTSGTKVLAKGEVTLRQDMSGLLTKRRIYRRSRRSRKTRHRKPRFLNRRRPGGWLPPSIQAKVGHTVRQIKRICSLVPNPALHIEVGKFDVQKIRNPEIRGKEYRNGPAAGYRNTRYYVFARDGYTCQVCKKKGKVLQAHHILYRSKGGSDAADNLITVCSDCHTPANHQPGGILHRWMTGRKKPKSYREAPFMNIVRKRLMSAFPEAEFSFGYETEEKRRSLDLDKTHYNDAVAVSGIERITENPEEWFEKRQFRKKKRSLYEANPRKGRSRPNREAARNRKNTPSSHGFRLNDKVELFGQTGYITGFTSGGVRVKNVSGEYIRAPEKNYTQVPFGKIDRIISHNNNWQYYVHKEEPA